MRKFVDGQWMKAELDNCFAKLNPAIIAAMEKKIPDHVATFRDVVMPANEINVIPNLAPMLASLVNQVCEHFVTAQGKKLLPEAKRANSVDARRTIELNVIAQVPKRGGTIRRATGFDAKGNVIEMTETQI